MSSRSTSPTPPLSNNNSGPERSGTLSKDALYAPLSTYKAVCLPSKHDDTASATVQKKKSSATRHSLSLYQTKSSSVPSLITALTSMSQDLKTSHPHEWRLYRGMGGSIARFGMGDNDRASGAMRGVLEGKLVNRSLVLVGGGVHNSSHASSAKIGDGGTKEMGGSVVGMGMALQAASGGKRERKRAGGNGIFGSVSNKKRKRILHRILEEKQSKRNAVDSELKVHDGNDVVDHAAAKGEQHRNEKLDDKKCKKKSQDSFNPTSDTEENIGTVIGTLHEMWVDYMHQLLSPITKGANNVAATSSADSPSLTLADRKRISVLLATAEHVGMPAIIVECPSRRHLVRSRCIVVNETRETWKVAMMVLRKKKRNDGDSKPKEKSEVLNDNCINEKGVGSTKHSTTLSSHLWKIVMVPKRATELEVDLPWDNSSVSKSNSPVLKNRCITVRLEM